MKLYPRLKFCGFTRELDIENAIQAGASAIGLNFVVKSKRYIDPSRGVRLSQIAAGRIQRVGVFANATPLEVAEVVGICELDAIQLHGSEGLDWFEEAQQLPGLRGLPLIRALAYRGGIDDPFLAAWSSQANDQHSPVSAILVDAYDANLMGGTGKTVRWDLLFPRPRAFYAGKSAGLVVAHATPAPLILAGGIDRNNVAEACRLAQPDGIDLASGIESEPGIKDRDAMFAVAEQVRDYFERHANQ